MERALRLTRRTDFSIVYRKGKSFANHQFVVYVRKQQETVEFRLGVSVSKKIGNAVTRNAIKRRVKEIIRLHRGQIEPQTDFVVIVRKPAAQLEYRQLEKCMLHVLKKASLLTRR